MGLSRRRRHSFVVVSSYIKLMSSAIKCDMYTSQFDNNISQINLGCVCVFTGCVRAGPFLRASRCGTSDPQRLGLCANASRDIAQVAVVVVVDNDVIKQRL